MARLTYNIEQLATSTACNNSAGRWLTRDSGNMPLCAHIILCTIGDSPHNWSKCAQSSDLYIIQLFDKWSFAV